MKLRALLSSDIAASVVLLASGAGFFLASATWHTALGVEVKGTDLEGREGLAYGLGSLAAALIAGYRVAARGPFLARWATLPAAVACSAVAKYLWTMHRSRGVILDTLREAGQSLPAGLSSGVAPAAWAAAGLSVLSLAFCLGAAVTASGERTPRR